MTVIHFRGGKIREYEAKKKEGGGGWGKGGEKGTERQEEEGWEGDERRGPGKTED